jgi:hypothetical protein
MSILERALIKAFVGTACPLLTFVALWWSTALLHMHIPALPLTVVIVSSVAGLGLGLVLDVLMLGRWVQRFYSANLWLMVVLYLSLAATATAFLMGIPAGTMAVGALAGVYMGRRAHHAHSDPLSAVGAVRVTALAAGAVTAVAALPIGLLALREEDIMYTVGSLPGMGRASLDGVGGILLICLLCVVLFVLQYALARKAGLVAFGLGSRQAWPRR